MEDAFAARECRDEGFGLHEVRPEEDEAVRGAVEASQVVILRIN